MNAVKSPCMNCERRFPKCHCSCQKYWDYKRVVEKARNAEKKEALVTEFFRSRDTARVKHLQRINGKQIFNRTTKGG